MKYFIGFAVVLLTVFQLTFADDPNGKIEQAIQSCIKEEETNQENQKWRCLAKCVYDKLNVLDANGNFKVEALEELLEKKFTEEQKKGVKECDEKYRNEADKCEQVAKSEDCLVEKLK